MNKLYVMIGIPGSGKSTYAKQYLKDKYTIYVSRDEIRYGLLEEADEYFSKEKTVFDIFIQKIQDALNNGYNVIADATHTYIGARLKLFSALDIDTTKTEVIGIVMQTPLEECIKRNQLRTGRACVPVETVRQFYKNQIYPRYTEYNNIFTHIYYINPKTQEGTE